MHSGNTKSMQQKNDSIIQKFALRPCKLFSTVSEMAPQLGEWFGTSNCKFPGPSSQEWPLGKEKKKPTSTNHTQCTTNQTKTNHLNKKENQTNKLFIAKILKSVSHIYKTQHTCAERPVHDCNSAMKTVTLFVAWLIALATRLQGFSSGHVHSAQEMLMPNDYISCLLIATEGQGTKAKNTFLYSSDYQIFLFLWTLI